MHRRDRKLRTPWYLWYAFLAFLALVVLSPWLAMDQMARNLDPGRQTPEQVFRRVFGRPVPQGVSEIRSAGFGSLGGGNAWLRFRTTDAALRALLQGMAPVKADPEAAWGLTDPNYVRYADRIGWGAVRRIRRPEYYWAPGPGGQGGVTVTVDRERGLVFVEAYWT